ncbi:MAG: hypothetical protein PHR82_07490 [Endomicrobiaceae bacterium]|nr:hypothetical protein [Endomicrobiaceae bacterium]
MKFIRDLKGLKKIYNLFLLLKKSLTIWIAPAFFIAFLFQKSNFDISAYNFFAGGLIWFYLALFTATNTKLKFIEYPKILNFLKLYLLVVISVFIFFNNQINSISWILNQIIIFAAVFILCTVILSALKKKINFKLNFISRIFEIMFIISVILFGVKSVMTFYILSTLMLDFFYTITFLSITNHFNKKYTH